MNVYFGIVLVFVLKGIPRGSSLGKFHTAAFLPYSYSGRPDLAFSDCRAGRAEPKGLEVEVTHT